MTTKFGKVLDKILGFFENQVCAVLFAIMCTVIMIQIIFRVAGLPLAWTEELARYLFVWIIYLGASRAVKNGNHMSVDLLPLLLKGRAHTLLILFAQTVTVIFFAILLFYGVTVLQGMTVRTQYSPASHINMLLPYAAPTVGSLFMLIRQAANIIHNVRELISPEQGQINAEGGAANE